MESDPGKDKMELGDESVDLLDSEQMTAKVVQLQSQLDQLRFKSLKARTEYESLISTDESIGDKFYPKEDITAEKLNSLTQGRTKSCLNYCTLQDALRGSEAVKALKAGLDLLEEKEKGDIAESDNENNEEINLEPEERDYVIELIEEEKELSKELTVKSQTCIDQEIEILQMRKEVAENLCRISELGAVINSCGSSSQVNDSTLQKSLKVEEAKLNQLRLIIQRLMMGEENLGQAFDPATNDRFKGMFYRCGLKPQDLLNEDKMDLTPSVP